VARVALVHDVAGVAKIQAQLLRGAGHEVDEIALPQMGAGWDWPAKALTIPVRLAAYVPTIRRLRTGRYDVIHIHWLTQGVVGLWSGQPFFAQAHGSDLHVHMGNPGLRWFTRRVLQKAQSVFYVTPNLRSFAPGFESKLRFLPNPVDVKSFAPESEPPAEIKKALIFTRLDPVKGVDQIFPAAEALSRTVEVTAVDWGPLSHEYVPRYREWVRFVPPVRHGEIGTFLQRFDVVIGQMRQGILSLMEIEALAAGRPLITGINPSLYAEDPPPVIAASSPEGIAAAVDKLKQDPVELARLSTAGRDWVCRNHGYERHLQLLQAAYFGQAKT
jgi:glycosyltransferase involved in cell wall biosynthesis